MKTFTKIALGSVVAIGLGQPALGATIANPKLVGTFTGQVTSGQEELFVLFGGTVTTPLAGSTFVLEANMDAGDADGFDIFQMYTIGGATNSDAGVRDDFGSLAASYANGVLNVIVSGGGFGNDSGTARLTANVVNGQFFDWRGTVSMGGQAGNNDWRMNAVMASLTFDGQFFGAVPEPATWAMMIAGFGMAGTAARRGRRALLGT